MSPSITGGDFFIAITTGKEIGTNYKDVYSIDFCFLMLKNTHIHGIIKCDILKQFRGGV